MFKLFVVYPFVAFVFMLILSDMEVSASLYKFSDNSVHVRFPRADWAEEPILEFTWNAETIHQDVRAINDE
ncbi:hypothetical protein [Motilimonas pumila]|uniref:Uncharacterized protein n=1 Tax=Motilimonas pumila TaxID=2303987 RepID=A0A418YJ27_9GAMM|nr:hypothetical protein [Motilimonas pumila]RJG50653.1 hypothetical protein D1Z90_04045 [Motilimonas pumila]